MRLFTIDFWIFRVALKSLGRSGHGLSQRARPQVLSLTLRGSLYGAEFPVICKKWQMGPGGRLSGQRCLLGEEDSLSVVLGSSVKVDGKN